jgi:hypothetical protein
MIEIVIPGKDTWHVRCNQPLAALGRSGKTQAAAPGIAPRLFATTGRGDYRQH